MLLTSKAWGPGFKIGILVCQYADIQICLYACMLTGSCANRHTFWMDGYGTIKMAGIGREGSAFAYQRWKQ